MKITQNSAAAVLSLLALSSEAIAANVVKAGIAKTSGSKNSVNHKLKSRSTFSSSLINNVTGGSYMIDLSIGTPPQPLSLVLDTGSSDVFALSVTADQCTSVRIQEEYGACTGGQFNSSASSTYSLVNKDFEIEYADSSGSEGDYFNDTITIGTSSIKQQQMGLALKTTVGVGIMGIGYDTNEAAQTEYPSIIDQMVSQGVISTKAYSLYLDDLEASTGTILFGGIDTDKYSGNLIALPIEKDSTGTYSSFSVALSGVSVTAENGTTSALTNSTFAEAVILDSGTTLTYLPDDLVNSLYTALGVTVQSDGDNGDVPFISCDAANTESKVTVDYSFGGTGGPTIKVPLEELILTTGDADLTGLDLPYQDACIFGVMSSGSDDASSNLLGDTFLRSAYVVYDIANNQVALAQTMFNQTSSHVDEISATATAIPLVSGVASSVTVAATGTVKPGVGGVTGTATGGAATVTVTSTSTSKAAAMSTVPAFDGSRLVVLAVSALFALAGGSWFLA